MRPALAALALVAASPALAAPHATIEDDYPRALAEARAKDLPILVEIWAPW